MVIRSLRIAPIAAALLTFGCSSTTPAKPQADMYVAVWTDIKIPDGIDTLEITANRNGGSNVINNSYDLRKTALPDVLLLDNGKKVDDQGNPVLADVQLDVIGLLSAQPDAGTPDGGSGLMKMIRRTATFDFKVDNAPVLLRMPLCKSCLGKPCPADQTCIGGACKPDKVDLSALPQDDGGPLPRARSRAVSRLHSSSSPPSSCLPVFLFNPPIARSRQSARAAAPASAVERSVRLAPFLRSPP